MSKKRTKEIVDPPTQTTALQPVRESLALSNGKQARITEVQPKKDSKGMIGIAPGFLSSDRAMQENAVALAERNWHAFAFNPQDGLATKKSPDPVVIRAEKERIDAVKEFANDTQIEKAAVLIQMMDAKNVEKMHFVAHSEGAFTSAIAAFLRPDLFCHIVFVNPAGTLENDRFNKLIQRFTRETAGFGRRRRQMAKRYGEIRSRQEMKAANKESKEYLQGKVGAAIDQAKGMARYNIGHILMSKQEGVTYSIVHTNKDVIFPGKKVQAFAEKHDIPYYEVDGGHNAILDEPQRFAGYIDESIESSKAI